MAVDFSQGQSGYESAMMIGAAFGQSYVNAYFSAGLSLYDQGLSNVQVATIIVNAGLIESQIGSISNTAWLDFVYKNVTGVVPDKLTEAIFVSDLNTGVYTKASLLALAAGVSNLEHGITENGFALPFIHIIIPNKNGYYGYQLKTGQFSLTVISFPRRAWER